MSDREGPLEAAAFRNWSNFWWGLLVGLAMPAMIVWVDPLGVLDGRGAFGNEPPIPVDDLPYVAVPVLISVFSFLFLVRPVVLVRAADVWVRNPFRTFSFSLESEPEVERTFMGYLRFRWPGRSLVAYATEVPLISDLRGSAGVHGRLLGAISHGDDSAGITAPTAGDSTGAGTKKSSNENVRRSFRLWPIDLVLAAIVGAWLLYAYLGYRNGYPF